MIIVHYENISMQYTAIFHGSKMIILDKKSLFSYFCPKHRIWFSEAVLTSTYNLCFIAKHKKIMYTPVNPNFTV